MKHTRNSRSLALIALLPATFAGAQQDVPANPRPFNPEAVTLPSSVDKLQAAKAAVLVIPEADILRGIELSEKQREALTANLRKAKFSTYAQTKFDAKDLAAQRLPSGELLQVMQQNFAPSNPPFTLGDQCAVADYSDDQVTALHKVLVSQVRAQGGDADAFVAKVPKDCRRKQMVYYMKAVLLVAK